MTDQETPKPCWRCGSEAATHECTWTRALDDPLAWDVHCASAECGVRGPSRATEAEAIAAWNQRTPDAAALTAARREGIEAAARVADEYVTRGAGFWGSDAARKTAYAIRRLLDTGEPTGDGWRTMDSAPKDGTPVLLYRPPHPFAERETVIVARWVGHIAYDDGEADQINAWCWPAEAFIDAFDAEQFAEQMRGGSFFDAADFVAWMPLPTPPTGETT